MGPVSWVKWGRVMCWVVASFHSSKNCDHSCIKRVWGDVDANTLAIKREGPFSVIAEGVSEVLENF